MVDAETYTSGRATVSSFVLAMAVASPALADRKNPMKSPGTAELFAGFRRRWFQFADHGDDVC